MQRNDPIRLSRACTVTEIPSGHRRLLPAGAAVRIRQAVGDTYTVTTDLGHMYRIEAEHADALGLIPPSSEGEHASPAEFSEQLVWDQLKKVHDPEIPVNIVDLGVIYSCQITDLRQGGRKIEVKMSMTAPGCGMGNVLRADVERRLTGLPGVAEVVVEVVFDPPWHPDRMSEAAKLALGLDLEPGNRSFRVL